MGLILWEGEVLNGKCMNKSNLCQAITSWINKRHHMCLFESNYASEHLREIYTFLIRDYAQTTSI